MDLTRDKELSLNLNTHLRPAIIRMKQGIPFSNPLLEHIKNDYTEVYLSVLTAIDDLEAMENIFFDANEIGYICLHIIAAINRPENVSSIKTALVCNEGLSIELFLTQIIESYFKEIKIVEVYRSNNIKELVPDSFDLVINTTNTKITSPNVIKSSTSFTQSDYSVIKHFIYFHAFDSKFVNYSLNNHLMYFRDSLSSQEELLSKYCTYLHSIGFVTPKFLETVLERQQKSTTYVARGIAVPHGSKDEVLRSAVLIINLDEGIEWDGNQVRTVIFIVANDEGSAEFSQLLRRIMRVASSDQLTINLHACNTITDFYEVINSPGVGSF